MTEPGLHVVAGLGAVGRAIVEELVGRGLPVRAVARHQSAELPAEVHVVEADLADAPSARRALAGAASSTMLRPHRMTAGPRSCHR